jgi:phosphoribosylformylglycinamidine synthase
MPHPENLIDPLVGGIDGRGLFEGVAGFTRAA